LIKAAYDFALLLFRPHDGNVEFDILLDCFEFLEETMTELLESRREKMVARAASIVQNKGKSKP
jgi:hypothetical protein